VYVPGGQCRLARRRKANLLRRSQRTHTPHTLFFLGADSTGNLVQTHAMFNWTAHQRTVNDLHYENGLVWSSANDGKLKVAPLASIHLPPHPLTHDSRHDQRRRCGTAARLPRR
jgi:hypothetical protein